MDDSWIDFESVDDHDFCNAAGFWKFRLRPIRGFLVTERYEKPDLAVMVRRAPPRLRAPHG
jgi:hypothetical protein